MTHRNRAAVWVDSSDADETDDDANSDVESDTKAEESGTVDSDDDMEQVRCKDAATSQPNAQLTSSPPSEMQQAVGQLSALTDGLRHKLAETDSAKDCRTAGANRQEDEQKAEPGATVRKQERPHGLSAASPPLAPPAMRDPGPRRRPR